MGVADVLVFGEYPKYLVNHKVKEQGKLEASQPEARYAKLV